MIYAGVDPGLEGAIAFITHRQDVATFWEVHLTPTTKVGKKMVYLEGAMADLLRPSLGIKIALEDVHSMPKQGVASSFSFGVGLGLWRGIFAAFDIPYEMVSPQAWKKEFGLIGKPKSASRIVAARLFPSLDFSKKKYEGKAEALLLAEYGRRKWAAEMEAPRVPKARRVRQGPSVLPPPSRRTYPARTVGDPEKLDTGAAPPVGSLPPGSDGS